MIPQAPLSPIDQILQGMRPSGMMEGGNPMDPAGPSAGTWNPNAYSPQDRMEAMMQATHGATQWHPGMDTSGMAFARPYTNGAMNGGLQAILAGAFGQGGGPADGSWMLPQDQYNQLFPKSQGSGGSILGDFLGGFRDQVIPDFTPAARFLGPAILTGGAMGGGLESLIGSAGSGVNALDPMLAGGGEVGSGYAASAPGMSSGGFGGLGNGGINFAQNSVAGDLPTSGMNFSVPEGTQAGPIDFSNGSNLGSSTVPGSGTGSINFATQGVTNAGLGTPTQQNINSTSTATSADGGAMDMSGSNSYPMNPDNSSTVFGGDATNPGGTSNWWDELKKMMQTGGQVGTAGDVLRLIGGIKGLNAADDLSKQLNEINARTMDPSKSYDYRGTDDLVNQYLRDPMAVLRNNPGYLASVDFLTKQGQRQMAGKGYNNSGNMSYYLADTLGKNANDWYQKSWQPIKDAAGLSNYPNMGDFAKVQQNAADINFRAQQSATGDMFKAGTQALPNIFKYAF